MNTTVSQRSDGDQLRPGQIAVETRRGMEPVYEATTIAELEAIWEFRYRVYVEELHRKLGRDEQGRAWVHDPEDDQPYTMHLYTRDADGITGVMRERHWAPGEVPPKDFATFSMECFPGVQELTTGELGRLMVRPSERGTLLLVSLISAAYDLGAGRLHGDLAFLNCAPGLVSLYRRVGARPYDGRLVTTPDGIEVPMVMVMSDVAFFEQVRSFLVPLARRHFGPDGRPRLDAGRFAQLFEAADLPFDVDPAAVWERFEERLERGGPPGFLDMLTPETLRTLAAEGLLLSVPAGELLTEKGLVQREMFVIVEGLFEIVDGERSIALLEAGDVVGEHAFFSTEGRRSASVRAAAGGRVVVLRRRFVDGLRGSDPACAAELLFALARVLADRSVTSR
jgi:hypothetical protein